MSATDPLREMFVLWPAYQTLHEYLRAGDARTTDPRDTIGPLAEYGETRAVCLLHAHAIGETLRESRRILRDLTAMLHTGRRPRYGRELGFHPEDFGVTR